MTTKRVNEVLTKEQLCEELTYIAEEAAEKASAEVSALKDGIDKIAQESDVVEEIVEENLDDNKTLDAMRLSGPQWSKGILKCIVFSLIAVIIFFVPITVGDTTDVTFGIIYKGLKKICGLPGTWVGGLIIIANGLLCAYGKFISKDDRNPVRAFYKEDTVIHAFLYLIGSAFSLIMLLHLTFPSFAGPEWIVGPDIGESVIGIAIDVAWIIPVSAVFMPFLLNYGIVDFIGSLMEPLMRPVFKVPGRSAVNAIASFVSSASVGVLITSRLYRRGIYTHKEAALIATGFSAVSVGFAYKVIETADLAAHFLPIYFLAMLITLLISFFMCRIPPLSRKPSVYLNGRVQTKEDIAADRVPANRILKTGAQRAVKKAATAPPLAREIGSSLIDSFLVLPKVISLLLTVGIIAMIIATYTPVFNWLGMIFIPILKLFAVPNAAEIAPALPVGIAEMFLPVLMIADKTAMLAPAARYMVVTVSMVQIIFFSETIVVMMQTKIPVKLSELVICFFERTIIAIPISALFMHLLF